jgi:hypothetical protein
MTLNDILGEDLTDEEVDLLIAHGRGDIPYDPLINRMAVTRKGEHKASSPRLPKFAPLPDSLNPKYKVRLRTNFICTDTPLRLPWEFQDICWISEKSECMVIITLLQTFEVYRES